MRIEYCRLALGNVGDDLNPWLFSKILSQPFTDTSETTLIGIGTLLSEGLTRKPAICQAKEVFVFSTGSWPNQRPELDDRWTIFGVRGPRTAERLGLPPNMAIGDGGYLVRNLDIPRPAAPFEIGFTPHHKSVNHIDWQAICAEVGVKFISPRKPVESFIEELLTCRKLITEAMHGAILADAFRIPWVPIRISEQFLEDKWQDWAAMLDLSLEFQTLPDVRRPAPERGRWKAVARRMLDPFGPQSKIAKRVDADMIPVPSRRVSEILMRGLQRMGESEFSMLSTDRSVEGVTDCLNRNLQLVKARLEH